MIQLQLSLMYLTAFLVKIKGATWLQGTAPFYVYHLDELRHFPLPSWFFRPTVLKLGDWSALALEFSLGVLIWVKEFRYALLGLGLLFHFWLEYSLNIPLFQWDILSAYILFVDPVDIARTGSRIRTLIRSRDLSSLERISYGTSRGRTSRNANPEAR